MIASRIQQQQRQQQKEKEKNGAVQLGELHGLGSMRMSKSMREVERESREEIVKSRNRGKN